MCLSILSICRAFIIVLFLHSINAYALNFSSAYVILNCENRGRVEVLFHVYGHVQEVWEGNFEVGSGHKNAKGYNIVFFRNGDVLFHNLYSDAFSYHYYDNDRGLYSCSKISEQGTHPVNLDKVSENLGQR